MVCITCLDLNLDYWHNFLSKSLTNQSDSTGTAELWASYGLLAGEFSEWHLQKKWQMQKEWKQLRNTHPVIHHTNCTVSDMKAGQAIIQMHKALLTHIPSVLTPAP